MYCPFCRSTNLLPIANSQGKHWLHCVSCKANGPQTEDAESASAAFVAAPAAKPQGLIARVLGRKS